MASACLVEIDLATLQNHFAETGEPVSFEDAEAWLREMGFKRQAEGWLAESISLGALDRTEYRILKRL